MRKNIIKKQKPASYVKETSEEARRSLMWILVIGFIVIVFIGWIFAFRYNLSKETAKNQGEDSFESVRLEMEEAFGSIEQNLLKLRDAREILEPALSDSEVNESGLTEGQVKALRDKVIEKAGETEK